MSRKTPAMLRRDGDNAIRWAQGILADERVLILDTETTGLDSGAEIVQVALVNLAGEMVLDTLVKPTRAIPDEVIRIHGITNEMVADAPGFDVVHRQLADLLLGKRVVIYNSDFDTRLIRQSGVAYGYLSELLCDFECAMKKYAAFYGEWNEQRGEYRWQKLRGGDHSAKGDCLATLALIKRMAGTALSVEPGGRS